MNHLRIIALIALIFLLTHCTFQRAEKVIAREYTRAELIGKWKQVSTDESIKDTLPKIESIQLRNDSVAEIQILDTNGVRTALGKWEKGFKEEIKPLNMTFESDLKVSFSLTANSFNVLVLKLGEENKKAVMTGYQSKFEKE
jgi:hypothetical protein